MKNIKINILVIFIIFFTYNFLSGASKDYEKAVNLYNEKKYEDAYKIFLKLAEKNDIDSIVYIGYMHDYGYGVKQDVQEALKWYIKASDLGSIIAKKNIAFIYYDGVGMQKDYKKALDWFLKAQEDKEAQYYIGLIYFERLNDYKNAIEYFEKSANAGQVGAQEYLGYIYHYAKNVEKNIQKAVYWYSKASDQGSNYARKNMAFLYYDGLDAPKDYKKALEWFLKAQEDKEAQYYIGLCYYDGTGVTEDKSKAFSFFLKSAENKHVNAMEWTGYMYELGYGVEKNYQKAMEWYQKAADNNSNYGYFGLGIIYYEGKGTEKDLKKAFDYFLKSSELGNINACEYLGYMYEFGEGTVLNYNKAVEWYKKAAEKNSAYAENRLGMIYYDINKDIKTAYNYFNLAASKGNNEAKNKLKEILDAGYKFEENKNQKDITGPVIYLNFDETPKKSVQAQVTVKGNAVDGSGVALVYINEKEAKLDAKGNFSASILLKIGENPIKVRALDINENQSEESFFITRYEKTDDQQYAQKPVLNNWYKKQYALVIGINDYENPKIPDLKNAVSDAESVAALLKKSGYTVTLLIGKDAFRKNILNEIRKIKSEITSGDSFLFYFAGHGQALNTAGGDKKVGYIIPFDAKITLDSGDILDYEEEALSLDQLKKYINDIPAKHIALILDSCFSGLLMENRGLKPINQKGSSIDQYETLLQKKTLNILTAGDVQTVSDGTKHSPLVQAMLLALEQGNIDLSDNDGFCTFYELAVFIKSKVEIITDKKQRPQFDNLSLDDGEYIFRTK